MSINPKLGFYTCNGQTFDSKIQAYLYAATVKQQVQWNFNNEAFQKHDWTVEPEETLDQLYDARARQIREKYDYVILSYSGGADSHNILMSFIRQGLLIDEIVVNTMEKANSKFTIVNPTVLNPEHAAAEHKLNTIPRLKEVEHLIPRTKINILDLSDNLFQSLETAGDASWVLDKREGLNPLGATRFNYIHFTEVRKRFDKEKTIGLVLGIEKPRTMIINDGFYMRFSDRSANIVTVAEHVKEYTNSTVEFFYWSPDCLPLLTKQAHVIKKWIEANPEKKEIWTKEAVTSLYRTVHERILRSLLYTTWDNQYWQADKATKDWYSEFDTWFIDGYRDTKANAIWWEGINYVKNNLPTFMLNYKDRQADGLLILGHSYYIGKMNNVTLVE
jgi:hypothetical protein